MRQPLLISLGLLIGSTGQGAANDTFRLGACNGSYEIHSSGATAIAGPLSMPVGEPVLTGAQIKMGECGREMTVSADGVTAVLYQDTENPRSYHGSINMGDGADRRLSLTVGEDRNLRGGVIASDSNMKVTRPLWFMLTSPTKTHFEGCSPDTNEQPQPSKVSAEEAAVIEHLAALGYQPAGNLKLADYVTTKVQTEHSSRVSLRLSRDNEILPRPDIASQQLDDESAYCINPAWLDPTHRFLDIKIQYADSDPFVFVRIIDVETSKILSQAEGIPAPAEAGALQSALNDGWQKLAPALLGMTNGVVSR